MISVLSKCSLFAGLTPQELDHFIACKNPQIKSYQPRETIFREDSIIHEIGIIISGEVLIVKTDFFGNENIIMHLKEADTFGEANALHPSEPSRVLVLAKRNTVVAFFDINQFIERCNVMCSYHHTITINLLKVLTTKLIELHKKVDTLSKRTIREKLLEYLHQLPKHNNSVILPFSRQELANYLNVDRSALAREMKAMLEARIIAIEGKRISFLK